MERVIRDDFPFLSKHPNVAYFDTAATALKPKCVIDAVVHYYTDLGANVHRGDYKTSIETSNAFDAVRTKTAQFFNADEKGIIFTSGASESLNLVAISFGEAFLKEGDVILLNEAEHASNVLPWYSVAKKTGAVIEFVSFDEKGHLTPSQIEKALHPKVKIVSIAHVSNILGRVNDIKTIGEMVHKMGAYLCVDGAQAVGHRAIDLKDLDIDFYAFSAHKMFGPSGVGVLYGRPELLEKMTPIYYGGGSNARFNACGDVSLKEIPYRFESGTPNIEGVIGFGAALDYLDDIGFEVIHNHEMKLHTMVIEGLKTMDHVEIYNESADTGIVIFNVKDIFAQDVAAYLDTFDICVRSGNHCSKLASGVIKTENTLRLSLHIYNTEEEVNRFLEAIKNITIEKTIDTYL